MHYVKSKIIALVAILFFSACEKKEELEDTEFNYYEKNSLNVPVTLAREVALQFQRTKVFSDTIATTDREIDDVITVPDLLGQPAMYIVNFKNGGFVIVSASKIENPILGFSDQERFKSDTDEDIPSGLGSWLYRSMEKIQFLRTNELIRPQSKGWDLYDSSFSKKAKGSGVEIYEREVFSIPPLLKSSWGQGRGYNSSLSPMGCLDPKGKPPVGCVATAFGQIFRYWEVPKRFKWEKMSLNRRPSYSENEVSKLLKEIGDAVDTSYDCDGSGSRYLFSYADHFTGDSWNYTYSSEDDYDLKKIMEALDLSRPVFLLGCMRKTIVGWWVITANFYSKCHTWVCDGYRDVGRFKKVVYENGIDENPVWESEEIYLHMNWGWDGRDNGFFRENNWYTRGAHTDYKYKRGMIIGLRPKNNIYN